MRPLWSAAFVCVLALAACGPSPETRSARAAAAVVARADSAGRVFRGTVGGHPLALMVDGCAVYDLADAPRGADGARDAVLTTAFYPWPTVCTRESIVGDTAWVTVHLGRTGFGAGGCCATGGTYRTRDGRRWEQQDARGRWAATDSLPPDGGSADSASGDGLGGAS